MPDSSTNAVQAAAVICASHPSSSLGAVLHALDSQSVRPVEVLIVAGFGEQELPDWVRRPWVRVLPARSDRIAAQRNQGLRTATADLVAFFDDDSIPNPRWFEELTQVFLDQPGACAAAGGATIDERQAGRPLVFRNGVATAAGRLEPVRLEPGSGQMAGDTINFLDRANLLCSRRALLEIGGFDEAFDSVFREVDLCARLARAGYRVVHHTRAIVHLLRKREVRGRADERLAAAARDRTYFLRKFSSQTGLEAARSVLRAGREQRHALRRAGMTRSGTRPMFRAWAAGVRAGLAQPLAAPPAHVASPAENQARSAATKAAAMTRRAEHLRWQIALVCGVFEAGHNGISEYTRLLAESFTAHGHGVTVFRTNKAPPAGTTRPYQVFNVEPRRGELYQAAVGRCIAELHRRSGLDIVEAPIWLGEACGAGMLAPYPVVTRLVTPADVLHRTSGVSLEHERANQTSMERLQLAISRGIIGISQAVCDTIAGVFGITLRQPGRPLSIIPLGLPSAQQIALVERPLPSRGRPVILFVGRLHQRKGILDLGEAFARLAPADRRAQLWIVGRDYSELDGFRERTGVSYIDALRQIWRGKAESQAHFVGEVDDGAKNYLISQADVVVVPSWYESFGLVLLEAMRLGKPVVACAAGGMPEIVRDNEMGLLVPPNDPPRLADAVARLCSDAALRRRMGAAALERFERVYRLDRCVACTEAFYAEVIESSRGSTESFDRLEPYAHP